LTRVSPDDVLIRVTRALHASAALIAATLFLTPLARADLAPEPVYNPCAGKKVGDPCDGGVCKDSTCCTTQHVSATLQHYESRKPLAEQNQDIINPPETCNPCLACEAQPVAATPPAPPATPTKPAATGGGMCTVAPWPDDLGAAGLLLGVMLYTGLRRSRRAR